MWQQSVVINGSQNLNPFPINYTFVSHRLAIQAVGIGVNLNWNRAGYFVPIIDVSSAGLFKSRSQRVYFGKNYLRLLDIEPFQYVAEFKLESWVSAITLTFWEFT